MARIISRRGFLKVSGGLAVGSVAFPYVVASSALGKSGALPPSERITAGIVGLGDRGVVIRRRWWG